MKQLRKLAYLLAFFVLKIPGASATIPMASNAVINGDDQQVAPVADPVSQREQVVRALVEFGLMSEDNARIRLQHLSDEDVAALVRALTNPSMLHKTGSSMYTRPE